MVHWETFAGIVPASKFSLVGGALFGARALQKIPGQKVPGSIPAAARLQHILLDVDDDKDDGHEKMRKMTMGMRMRMMKMMKMELRIRMNLRMMKNKDDKG